MPALTVVVRQSVTGMNPPSVHGVMLTVCSIRAMFIANVRELNVITVVFSKPQHLLNGRTAATPLLFEGYAMMIMADVPRRKASRLLRCNEKTLASILSYWVNQAVEALDLSDVTKLAIDETSRKRGHDYVTVTIDAMKRRVFDVQDGRKKEAVTAMRKKLERHGGKASNITAVTSDMSKSYLPGVRENFPDAEQIIDKFHVKKVLTDALDKVRKQEQKETNNKKDLFLNRHFLMTPQSRMNSEQLTKLAALSKAYPKTGRAFRIV